MCQRCNNNKQETKRKSAKEVTATAQLNKLTYSRYYTLDAVAVTTKARSSKTHKGAKNKGNHAPNITDMRLEVL